MVDFLVATYLIVTCMWLAAWISNPNAAGEAPRAGVALFIVLWPLALLYEAGLALWRTVGSR